MTPNEQKLIDAAKQEIYVYISKLLNIRVDDAETLGKAFTSLAVLEMTDMLMDAKTQKESK